MNDKVKQNELQDNDLSSVNGGIKIKIDDLLTAMYCDLTCIKCPNNTLCFKNYTNRPKSEVVDMTCQKFLIKHPELR